MKPVGCLEIVWAGGLDLTKKQKHERTRNLSWFGASCGRLLRWNWLSTASHLSHRHCGRLATTSKHYRYPIGSSRHVSPSTHTSGHRHTQILTSGCSACLLSDQRRSGVFTIVCTKWPTSLRSNSMHSRERAFRPRSPINPKFIIHYEPAMDPSRGVSGATGCAKATNYPLHQPHHHRRHPRTPATTSPPHIAVPLPNSPTPYR